ncbi:DNA-3-methyladenine glycosylase [Natranaerovirga pectinivora]|uniref:Putative 3-methyladenine DNA glycosylase n=1 Tax=Natranaerovirga pectinivora TaxID=682400 RepID=A0A4R3MN56_9FIRM|nr:DNA-3-methyladenine glycosylase [Natranaerovirga pectinivora]TCT14622.1 DNA-3-methyladenine glycosylase [Natranaerovirga pectinivora]
MKKLERDFYNRHTLEVSKDLLGKYIVRRIDDEEVLCKITEVEAYIGRIDKACHAYGNRLTERTKVMFGLPGYAYVYLIYGMYYCLNVVTEGEGEPSAVLIRGVEPVSNIGKMSLLRYGKAYDELSKYQIKNFSNGPGKLCKALGITKSENGLDLLGDDLYICDSREIIDLELDVKVGKRINIDYAEEAVDFLWRFYL